MLWNGINYIHIEENGIYAFFLIRNGVFSNNTLVGIEVAYFIATFHTKRVAYTYHGKKM